MLCEDLGGASVLPQSHRVTSSNVGGAFARRARVFYGHLESVTFLFAPWTRTALRMAAKTRSKEMHPSPHLPPQQMSPHLQAMQSARFLREPARAIALGNGKTCCPEMS